MSILPLIEILLANIIWGFGFVATAWALESFNEFQIFFLRIFVAAVVGLIAFAAFGRTNLRKYLRLSFLPSFFLALEIFFQIFSLKYTKATEGGFLFVTYILMVPLLEFILFKKRLGYRQVLWIFMGLGGSYLMIEGGVMAMGLGEFAMLLSALFASCHLIVVDRTDREALNSFYFNTFQLFWSTLMSLPLLLIIDLRLKSVVTWNSLLGLGALIFGSTLIAYFLQIKAQKSVSPMAISILFLLESIFSAIFASLLLGERITLVQWVGALLITLSALAVSFELLRKDETGPS